MDVSSVEKGLVSTLTNTLFDGGNPNPDKLLPCAVAYLGTPVPMRVYREWPLVDRLKTELAAGGCNVSIYTVANNSTNVTRQRRNLYTHKVEITVTATISGSTVTFSGTGTAGQVVGVSVGETGYAYRLAGGETPTAIASYFATIIPGSTSQGGVLGDLGANIASNVVSDVVRLTEVRRQVQRFLITVWAPTPQVRDLIGSAASMSLTEASCIRSKYGSCTEKPVWRGVSVPQADEKVNIYRRDETWDIEYATHRVQTVPALLFPTGININNSTGLFGVFGPSGPSAFIW